MRQDVPFAFESGEGELLEQASRLQHGKTAVTLAASMSRRLRSPPGHRYDGGSILAERVEAARIEIVRVQIDGETGAGVRLLDAGTCSPSQQRVRTSSRTPALFFNGVAHSISAGFFVRRGGDVASARTRFDDDRTSF